MAEPSKPPDWLSVAKRPALQIMGGTGSGGRNQPREKGMIEAWRARLTARVN